MDSDPKQIPDDQADPATPDGAARLIPRAFLPMLRPPLPRKTELLSLGVDPGRARAFEVAVTQPWSENPNPAHLPPPPCALNGGPGLRDFEAAPRCLEA